MSNTPSIGMKVWFIGVPWTIADSHTGTPVRLDAKQPMAATIVYIHNQFSVNLDVIDHAGTHWPMHNVSLLPPGADVHPGFAYAQIPGQPVAASGYDEMLNLVSNSCAHQAAHLADHHAQPYITMSGNALSGTGQLSARLQ